MCCLLFVELEHLPVVTVTSAVRETAFERRSAHERTLFLARACFAAAGVRRSTLDRFRSSALPGFCARRVASRRRSQRDDV